MRQYINHAVKKLFYRYFNVVSVVTMTVKLIQAVDSFVINGKRLCYNKLQMKNPNGKRYDDSVRL